MPPKRDKGINEVIVTTHLVIFFLIVTYFGGCEQPSLTLNFTYFPSYVFQLIIMFCNKRFHVSFSLCFYVLLESASTYKWYCKIWRWLKWQNYSSLSSSASLLAGGVEQLKQSLREFRTCCPQVPCFSILITLSWKYMKNARYKEVCLISPFSL